MEIVMAMEMEISQLGPVQAQENYVFDLLFQIPPKVKRPTKAVLLPDYDLLEGGNRCKESEFRLLGKE